MPTPSQDSPTMRDRVMAKLREALADAGDEGIPLVFEGDDRIMDPGELDALDDEAMLAAFEAGLLENMV